MADTIRTIASRTEFDALFQQGASVTAGAPSELKFLVDRADGRICFLPPKYAFHYDFYREVLGGKLDSEEFNRQAYNRPDRTFIPGTVTAYDSFVDPTTGVRGEICFSLWPTDRFDVATVREAHDAIRAALTFLDADRSVAFRVGGPIQARLAEQFAAEFAAAKIRVRTNVEISTGLTYMALSQGEAFGHLVLVEQGATAPLLRRTDVALFLGDVPAVAPPVAAMITTQVQTFNSHLGIKFRQDDIPFFYKRLSDAETTTLRGLAGKAVKVAADARDGTVREATAAEADAYAASVRPTGSVTLAPNLDERRVLPFGELLARSVSAGRWNPPMLAAYGRKTLGVVRLAWMEANGQLDSDAGHPPDVVAPRSPFGIPGHYYHRFVRDAKASDGRRIATHVKRMSSDERFGVDADWTAKRLDRLRTEIRSARWPKDLLDDLRTELVVPYLAVHPGITAARLRSSAPVIEDSGTGANRLPNMAGAFDSYSARWKAHRRPARTERAATKKISEAVQKVYASVFNDRAMAELVWNNVRIREDSMVMAVLVMPNEDQEKANGVLRVNADLAGFFSITGETQFGEALVTNPEGGATPDTFVDGNYDVVEGSSPQDIEYERYSNVPAPDPGRPRPFSDAEINAAYDAMAAIRGHFARLEGVARDDYLCECEVKVLASGAIQFKQERPWLN